jgi:hypothetical protein
VTKALELRKYAKRYLATEMRSRGFETIARKEDYYFRQVNGIYHFFWLELDRAGNEMRVMVHATVPEAYPEGYFDKIFPRVGAFTGGFLRADSIDIGADYWGVRTEQEAQSSLKQVLAAIDRVAIPWFDGIVTRGALVKAIRPGFNKILSGESRADLILRKGKP